MEKIRTDHRHTLTAAFLSLFVQALVNNFAPLLFLTFERSFGISLQRIALLVGFNFAVQLLTDVVFLRLADRIGYRRCMVLGNLLAGLGLIALGVLPGLPGDPFGGLMAAVAVYALGAGIIEVVVSPLVEHSPTRRKAAAMSLLHSFYCWGHMFVVLISTAFFALAGIGRWPVLALIWAVLPLLNAVYFLFVPVSAPPPPAKDKSPGKLLKNPLFWLLFLLLFLSGATELSIAQWSSVFAESGLGVSKAVGDLAGPMFFALMMGLSRLLHAAFGERVRLQRALALSALLCSVGCLAIALSVSPLPGFLGMGLAGFAVGLFWPGTLSLVPRVLPGGGTALYGLLALAGHAGCSLGPAAVGYVSAAFGGSLRPGFLVAAAFPLAFLVFLWLVLQRSVLGARPAAAAPSP